MPRSLAQIDLAGSRYIGIGYVERLTLTLPPWRLPFTFLLWGRHASASCSVIWIAWRGEDERCFIWHNGRPQSDAVLRERSIQGLTGGAELRIGEPRDVCARPALEQLVNRLPDAARSLAQPVAAMFEHKMVAPSRVIAVDGETDIGWTVFEEVRW